MLREGFFISTYFLGDTTFVKVAAKLKSRPDLFICEVNENGKIKNPFIQLQNVIKYAKANEDDIILVVIGDEFEIWTEKDEYFMDTIYKMIEQQIYFLALGGDLAGPLSDIGNELFYITEVKNLNGFLLMEPLFDLILQTDCEFISRDNYLINSGCFLEDVLNKVIFRKAGVFPPVLSCSYSAIKDNYNKYLDPVLAQRINIIIPFRNVNRYIRFCYESILTQDYSNYRVFFIDDCSDDCTAENIALNPKFVVVRNKKRKFALRNICDTLSSSDFEPEDIIVILDGDDALANEFVFSLLNKIYQNEKCLLTYGSFRIINEFKSSDAQYIKEEFEDLRSAPWKASHLKTFKYKVFDEYLKQDPFHNHMKDSDNLYYKMTYDMALMLPLLEIVGFEKTYFVKHPIYLYRLHENNDHVLNRVLQLNVEHAIRGKMKFELAF